MRCKFCSAPLPKKGLVCNYCNQRNPLNLNVLSKIEIEDKHETLNCPVCTNSFDNINIGLKKRVLVQRCHECDGVFITEDILEQLIYKQTINKSMIDITVLRFVQNNPRQKQETVIRYKKCPVCQKTMQRFNYRTVSGVVVDRCLRHGIWLDGGELKQLFEWKKAGGKERRTKSIKKVKKEVNTYYKHKSKDEASFDPLGNLFNWLQGG